MPKVLPIDRGENADGKEFAFICPACGNSHWFRTESKQQPSWEFNGDVEKPTIRPSIKVRGGAKGSDHVCHFTITDGRIDYCGDSSHALANRSVPMEDM